MAVRFMLSQAEDPAFLDDDSHATVDDVLTASASNETFVKVHDVKDGKYKLIGLLHVTEVVNI